MPTPRAASSPRPGIYIDGILNPSLSQDVLALTIDDAVSSPARCLVRFANVGDAGAQGGYKYFGLEAFNFGRRLTVWQGVPPDTLIRLFDGRIDLIEGGYEAESPPQVLVQAEDRLSAFRATQRTRVFQDMSDAQVIEAVAGEHGLNVDLQFTGPQVFHHEVVQLHQSDYAFLFDLVTAVGAEMWIEQDTLVVTDTPETANPGVLTYGDQLVSFAVRADLRRQATIFGVSGWNVQQKAPIGQSASDEDLPPGASDERSGGRVREEAFGQRWETMVDAVPESDLEAGALARAYHRRQSAEFLTGHGLAIGTPGLRAGRSVELAGLGPLFSGGYDITRVRHLFDLERGLRTEFEVRRSRIGRNAPPAKPREKLHAERDPRTKGA